jgi:hypothetical protein
MVVVKLFGGLGNQMFQYALGKSFSIKNNLEFKIESKSGFEKDFYNRKLGINNFNITAEEVNYAILPKKIIEKSKIKWVQKIVEYLDNKFPKINYLLCLNKWNIIHEKNKYFSPINYNGSRNLYLIGYWQSEKYFKNIREELINEFSLKNSLNNENLKIANLIINSNSVSVHYRRLHGISNGIVSKAHANTHGVISEEYYENSIKYIKNKISDITFFIFSDDISWAKENLKNTENIIFVDINDDDKNFLDLYLMSLCKHQIIANSSFSWWAAWLNKNPNKIIISPKKWYVDETLNKNDTIPENWITF